MDETDSQFWRCLLTRQQKLRRGMSWEGGRWWLLHFMHRRGPGLRTHLERGFMARGAFDCQPIPFERGKFLHVNFMMI